MLEYEVTSLVVVQNGVSGDSRVSYPALIASVYLNSGCGAVYVFGSF